jgi:hypothetical protein
MVYLKCIELFLDHRTNVDFIYYRFQPSIVIEFFNRAIVANYNHGLLLFIASIVTLVKNIMYSDTYHAGENRESTIKDS